MSSASKQKQSFLKKLFQTIFAQARDGIFLSDEWGRYIEVNPRGCEMLA
jgi:PAS domain-containing protein